jgi:hypothetical protein
LIDAVWQLFLVALSQNFLPQTGKYLGGAKSRLSPLAARSHSSQQRRPSLSAPKILFTFLVSVTRIFTQLLVVSNDKTTALFKYVLP